MAARDEYEFTVVTNERGKANIWRHFGLKNRKTDNTIIDNIAVCTSYNVEVKLAGGTSNLTCITQFFSLGCNT